MPTGHWHSGCPVPETSRLSVVPKCFLLLFLELLASSTRCYSAFALTTFLLGALSDLRSRGQPSPYQVPLPFTYSSSAWQHTWNIRELPDAPPCCDLHRRAEPQMETRGLVRTAECLCFSKAAAAAAQRQECITSSAILSEERGTERGGLWDTGGWLSLPLPSPTRV